MPIGKRSLAIIILLGLWLATCACSCDDGLRRAVLRDKALSPTATVAQPSATTASQRLATPPKVEVKPSPTTMHQVVTPTHRAVPTMLPTLPMPTVPAVASVKGFTLPGTANTPFELTATQQEINEYLAGETFEQQGLSVRDVQVTITASELIADLTGTQQDTGITLGLTVRGAPTVIDGALYVDVEDVTLDDSVKGLVRIFAQAAIEEAIKKNSGAHGIEVPVEDVILESVSLAPGVITVTGRTR